MVCRSQRGTEYLISADINLSRELPGFGDEWNRRSIVSARALGHMVNELARDVPLED